MPLHIEVTGSGEPLLLLHGWGMHGGVWGGIVPMLAQYHRVHVADLPGHGYSRETAPTLDDIVDALSAKFAGPLNVCGWSLGGIIAQRWAMREPEKVGRLVLVASTPCFTEHEGWPFGMAAGTLRQFAAELERDHAATLRRFLALQLRGSVNERELLADLRERLFSRGEPDMWALRSGLEILRDADLRAELVAIRQPVLAIAGERDRLTPPGASRHVAQAAPRARAVEIAGAAHVPFLSHPDIFVKQVLDFLNEPV